MFLLRSRAANSEVSVRILPKFKLIGAFMFGLVICKNEENPSKNEGTRVVTSSHYKSMVIFPDAQGQLTQKSLVQSCWISMLLMKFDYDWPAGLRDIHVWKCGHTDGRRLEPHTISSPWAFGSGELKHEKLPSMQSVNVIWSATVTKKSCWNLHVAIITLSIFVNSSLDKQHFIWEAEQNKKCSEF